MPPRIPPSVVSIAVPTPSIHTHCEACLRRTFSSTSTAQTRLRRQMYAWLQGPGKAFQDPLPNSTNYLSAYTRTGRLMRAEDSASSTPSKGPETKDTQALDAAAEDPALPPEQKSDLRPFPLNKQFISQSILSEELQELIWRRVQVDGTSVRQVSVEMGVDMRRVAAVVRLVEVERRMKAEVCACPAIQIPIPKIVLS